MFYKRTLSSIILVIITMTVILKGGILLAGVLFLLSVIAFLELLKAIGVREEGQKVNALESMGVVGICIYYLFLYFGNDIMLLFFSIIFNFMLIMFVYVLGFPRFQSEKVMGTFFNMIYAPVFLSFIYMTRNLNYGIYVVWLIFISSWICDTSAYLVGITLGRHKLSKILSPKKSIEGAVGGILGAVIVGAIFGYYTEQQLYVTENLVLIFAIISGVGAIISQVGDLAASAIKRNHEIKDYGKLIPGHGGVMDRFDSVIFTSPIIFFLAYFLMNQL